MLTFISGFKFSLLFQYLSLIAIVADKDALQRYLYLDGKELSLIVLVKSRYSFLNPINEAKVLVGIWLESFVNVLPLYTFIFWGFPGGSDSKESACNAGDESSIPGSGRAPGERNCDPLQYSFLEKSWTEEPGRLQSMGLQKVRHN